MLIVRPGAIIEMDVIEHTGVVDLPRLTKSACKWLIEIDLNTQRHRPADVLYREIDKKRPEFEINDHVWTVLFVADALSVPKLLSGQKGEADCHNGGPDGGPSGQPRGAIS